MLIYEILIHKRGDTLQTNTFLIMNNLIYQIYTIEDFDKMKRTFLQIIQMLIPNTFSSILMANSSGSESLLCNPICYPEEYVKMEN